MTAIQVKIYNINQWHEIYIGMAVKILIEMGGHGPRKLYKFYHCV